MPVWVLLGNRVSRLRVVILRLLRLRVIRSRGQWDSSILTANHRANGAREYIGLASTDEWMSCWGAGIRGPGFTYNPNEGPIGSPNALGKLAPGA